MRWRQAASKTEGIFAGATFTAPVPQQRAWETATGYTDLGAGTKGVEQVRILEDSPERQVIEIDLKNLGLLDHDFTIEKIDADDAMQMSGMVPEGHQVHMDEYNVHVAMVSKAEARLRLHVHERGTYEFFCTVPGHREAGMKGSLVVK